MEKNNKTHFFYVLNSDKTNKSMRRVLAILEGKIKGDKYLDPNSDAICKQHFTSRHKGKWTSTQRLA